MKKSLFIALGLLQSVIVVGQFTQSSEYALSRLTSLRSEKKRLKMTHCRPVICLTGVNVLDSAFKEWGKEYWKYADPIFADKKAFKKYNDRDQFKIEIETYGYKEEDGMLSPFYITKLFVYYYGKYLAYEFDSFTQRNSNQCQGIDDNPRSMAFKLMVYLQAFNAEIMASNSHRRWDGALETVPLKDLSEKTIFIPREYLDLGLKKEDFDTGLKYKHIFISTAELAEKIRRGDHMQNCCLFIMTKIDIMNNRLVIVNLDDFIVQRYIFASNYQGENSLKPISSKNMQLLLEQL